MSTYCSPNDASALRLDTAMRAAKGLTVAQADAIRRVRDRGSLAWAAGKGRAGGAVARMFGRLRTDGLVTGPPYAVTEFGNRVLDAWDAERRSPRVTSTGRDTP